MLHSALHTLSKVSIHRVRIAKFMRFVRSGTGSAGDRRSSNDSVIQQQIDFDSRISTAVQDFTSMNISNRSAHLVLSGFIHVGWGIARECLKNAKLLSFLRP